MTFTYTVDGKICKDKRGCFFTIHLFICIYLYLFIYLQSLYLCFSSLLPHLTNRTGTWMTKHAQLLLLWKKHKLHIIQIKPLKQNNLFLSNHNIVNLIPQWCLYCKHNLSACPTFITFSIPLTLFCYQYKLSCPSFTITPFKFPALQPTHQQRH